MKVCRNPITPPADLPPQTIPSPQPGKDTIDWLWNNWPAVAYRLVHAPAHRFARARDFRDANWAKKRPGQSGYLP